MTADAFAVAIIAGCRHRLLTARESSLRALREGFVEHVDLRLQLGALGATDLLRMLRGNTELTAADLSSCFIWPNAPVLAVEAGFAAVGSAVPQLLRDIVEDTKQPTALSPLQRLQLLEFCTALTALPCAGLKKRICLRLYADASKEALPCVHTCTHELHLPAYESRCVLRAKLLQAIEHHRQDGFLID